ncbi:hypothetical protein WJ91_17800 [Burkholderia ubonensis]|nr:hypothetical protein WJ91_17800 [Burkholderia ubonensis]
MTDQRILSEIRIDGLRPDIVIVRQLNQEAFRPNFVDGPRIAGASVAFQFEYKNVVGMWFQDDIPITLVEKPDIGIPFDAGFRPGQLLLQLLGLKIRDALCGTVG